MLSSLWRLRPSLLRLRPRLLRLRGRSVRLMLIQFIFEFVIFFPTILGRRSTCTLVQFCNDRLDNILHFLLLCFEIFSRCILVLFQPRNLLVDNFLDLALLIVRQLPTQLFLVR